MQKPIIPLPYNPFSGLAEGEWSQAIVPKSFAQEVWSHLQDAKPRIMVLLGPKGRGKTSHLRYFFEQFSGPKMLCSHPNTLPEKEALQGLDLLCLDNVERLPFWQRRYLYQAVPLVILTAHFPRPWEYLGLGKKVHHYRVRGIDRKILELALDRRYQLSSQGGLMKAPFSSEELDHLLYSHGDHFRGIMEALFKKYADEWKTI